VKDIGNVAINRYLYRGLLRSTHLQHSNCKHLYIRI